MSGFDDTSMKFDSVDEELVAYLDGELNSDEAAQIEARLAHDRSTKSTVACQPSSLRILVASPTSIVLLVPPLAKLGS